MWLSILFTSFACWRVEVLGNSATCPQFGSYQNASFEYSIMDGLFLAIDSPSQCYGKVTQWNFCYKRATALLNSTPRAVKFMVYRQSATVSVYKIVANSLTTFQNNNNKVQTNCTSYDLSQDNTFDIQPNDIVAACMIERVRIIRPIRAFYVSSGDRNESLQVTSISDNCEDFRLQSLDMESIMVEKRNFLLVEAVINSSSGFRAGNSPKGSSSSTLPGIYVNQAFPADSTGYVTSWNYCYYTSNIRNSSDYTAEFAIWRYSNESGSTILSMVNNSTTIITLQPQYTIAAIFCKNLELEPERYFPIMEGDYVGVVLPANNAIPLIGTTSDYNILVNNDTTETAVLSESNFQQQQLALHLYADIDIPENSGSGKFQPIPTFNTEEGMSTSESSTITEGISEGTGSGNFQTIPTSNTEERMSTSESSITTEGISEGTGNGSFQPIPTSNTEDGTSTSESSTTINEVMSEDTGRNGMFSQTVMYSSMIMESMTQTNRLSIGVVAAIVIITIIIIIVVVAASLIVPFVVQKKFKTSRNGIHISQGQSVPRSFENINYMKYDNYLHELNSYESMPGTLRNMDCISSSSHYEPSVDQPNQTAVSVLEASQVYASVNPRGDDLYANVIEQSVSQNVYAEVEPKPYMVPQVKEESLYSQIHTESRAENIPKKSIKILRYLGSGQSGSVHEGMWFKGSEEIKVAIKTIGEDASSQDKVRFLQEAVIMAQFKHENVIRLLGMVLEENPVILVMELASRGDLRKNLLEVRNERTEGNLPKVLLYFSRQIAFGMNYLSSKHFVHRDLAARNILLSENCICKIADFGLSRDLVDENYYKSSGGMVPVKWTAPEAIKYKRYSTASDVWSYGCVLYEIWSLGHKPFEKHQNAEILDILSKGNRLPPPTGCPRAIYATMIKCWHPNASERPSFRDLISILMKNEDILSIPESIAASVPEFETLGGDLNIGTHVYKELQKIYT